MAEYFSNLMQLDARASSRLRLERPHGLWIPAVILAHSGDSWLWMALLASIWLWARGGWRENAVLLAAAVGGQALVIFALKQLVRRERPAGEWGGIYRAIDPHSFPSGHATRAVLLAVMAVGLGPAWFAALLVLWAPLVSLARVATGVHYLSDILAGALIGLLMGLALLAARPLLLEWLRFLL